MGQSIQKILKNKFGIAIYAICASWSIHQTASAEDIRIAVIGDSYTVGVGDSCSLTGCDSKQPGFNGAFPYWINSPEVMQPYCGQFAGWPAKLAYLLGNNASVVGVCALNGASSSQLRAADCGTKMAALNPTHTFIYAGLNDNDPVDNNGDGIIDEYVSKAPGHTWYQVSLIGQQMINAGSASKRIHIQGNGEWAPTNWDQTITFALNPNEVHSGFPITVSPGNQCNAHPTGHGYWSLANQIMANTNW